jgi:exopolyphosphatase / guanosine-5'-triphosphate,3'-diphosphate pyrophosphatase
LKRIKEIKKYATIDIGSNAIRLLISNIIIRDDYAPQSTKNALVRVPVRLGQDAFTKGLILEENICRLIDSMKSFKLLMKVHKVEKYLAYATSALRNSSNCLDIVKRIESETGVLIKIIDGKKEAKLITNNNIFNDKSITYCFIDVGGGSTELTIIKNEKIIKSKSFKIGGVRLINNLVSEKTWKSFEYWIKDNLMDYKKISVVGFGGNINKIFKISGNKIGKPLSIKKIDSTISKLEKMTLLEKTLNLKLNPDRLDVIVPAGKIYKLLLNTINVDQIGVPKVGLADGMVLELLKTLKP